MASDRQVLWTALPAGIVNGVAKLSVYVSPRLTPPAANAGAGPAVTTLGAPVGGGNTAVRYAEFLNWAQTSINFQLQLDNGQTYPATFVEQRQPPVWNAFFPATINVNAFTFDDLSKWTIIAPPSGALAKYLTDTYQAMARLGLNDVPTFGAMVDLFTNNLLQIGDKGERYGPLATLVNWMNYRNAYPGVNNPMPSAIMGTLAQLYTFLKPSWPARTLPTAPTPTGLQRPVAPTLDFHQILATLASYPAVLRSLGIVFDLKLDAAGTAAVKAGAKVRVLPVRTGGSGVDKSPWTSYSAKATNGFAAAPQPGSSAATDFTVDGLIAVDQSKYSVLSLDVSGASVNLCNFVEQITRRGVDPEASAGLPALRSAGLSLAVDGRAGDLASLFQSAGTNNTGLSAAGDGGNITLYASDLTRGVRVDVQVDGSSAWSSLCGRTYQFNNSPSGVADEGALTTSATEQKATAPNAVGDLHVVDTLFRWLGNSLCLPSPGAPAAEKTGALQVVIPAPATSLPASPAPVPAAPSLLFGHGYRFRVRRVDLAGNGVAVDDATIATTSHVTPLHGYWTPVALPGNQLSWALNAVPTRYLRFEPVVAPTLRPVVAPTGPLLGESVGVIVVRTAGAPANSTASNSRRIDPPPVTAPVALQHGLSPAQIKTPPLVPPTSVLSPKTPLVPTTGPPKAKVFSDSIASSPDIDYTPDPLAVGVAFQNAKKGSFPNVQTLSVPSVLTSGHPFELKLNAVSASTPPSALVTVSSSPAGNVPALNVWLPPATVLKLRVSSTLDARGVELLALWDLTKQAIAQDHPDTAAFTTAANVRKAQAIQGLLPMLTPFREITLVHALDKPLAPALVSSFSCQARTLNQTSAYYSGAIQSDRTSTGKVDVSAAWTEWVDDGVTTPQRVQHEAHVMSATIEVTGPPADPMGTPALPGQQQFGDTLYRKVTYTPVASTRFAEYFPEPSVVPDPDQQQSGPAITLDILSTARPPAPRVRYIMPTFRWSRIDQDGRVQSRRRGGGFRVFLDRPWYGSGDGELLAVVVANPASETLEVKLPVSGTGGGSPVGQLTEAAVTGALAEYVTFIGGDPLSASPGPSRFISRDNFLDGVASASGLLLPEAPGSSIDVVGYPVSWSSAHQSWYADIHVDPYTNQKDGKHYFGYMPFVRFGVARYQPHSIPGSEVSPVIPMEPIQSVPDRTIDIFSAPVTPGTSAAQAALQLSFHLSGEHGGSSTIQTTYNVVLEQTASGAVVPKTEFDWQIVLRAAQTVATVGADLCTATVSLPSARGTRGYRVVVTETEHYLSSTGTANASRIVYADAVLL